MKSGLILSLLIAVPAWAAANKEVKKTEHEMATVCQNEYPKELKGKNVTAINSWIEKAEHGDNSEAFKTSKCYSAHEDWEKAKGKTE